MGLRLIFTKIQQGDGNIPQRFWSILTRSITHLLQICQLHMSNLKFHIHLLVHHIPKVLYWTKWLWKPFEYNLRWSELCDMLETAMLTEAMAFKQCSVCNENTSHVITPPCYMLVNQCLTVPSKCCIRNRHSSGPATFFQSCPILPLQTLSSVSRT